MARRSTAEPATRANYLSPAHAKTLPANVKQLFAKRNRGILLDVVVFALNVILIRLLTRSFVGLIQRGFGDDKLAQLHLGLYFSGMFVLPAAGADWERWRAHARAGGRFNDGDGAG